MRAPAPTHPRRLDRTLRTALAVVLGLVATLVVVPAGPAAADGAPAFQAPFPCGEVWHGATYAGHGWAIDFNTFNGDAWELGHPAVASAAGTVVESAYANDGRGHYVTIDHGGGWSTRYLHLFDRHVVVGQVIARGHTIGGIGGTPSYPVHLHYEQRLVGVKQPAVFDGVPFTYTNFDIPNGYQGLAITSKNCQPTFPPCGTFPDVDAASTFCPAITWLVARGIAGGYLDGTFRPFDSVSRQALAAFLWRQQGEPITLAPTFSDVAVDHAFADAIGWLAAAGVAGGFDDGTFRPTDAISRQAVASFLWKLAGSPTPTVAATFSDVPAGHPFATAISWMVQEGITTGYADGTFRPDGTLSRQAMAAFLQRAS